MYGQNSQLNRIVHIREHLGCFSDEPLSLNPLEISGYWIGKKRSMTPDLSISPEEDTQIFFDQTSGHHKMISLSGNVILMLPKRANVA